MADAIDSGAEQSEVFVASREKAKNGYGQNGDQHASSDLPGQRTRMDADYGVPDAPITNNQTRVVSTEQLIPLSHGVRDRSQDSVRIAPQLDRAKPTTRAALPVHSSAEANGLSAAT
ncbi:hypothetical protein [Bradyrhizobium sp. USDA 4508]